MQLFLTEEMKTQLSNVRNNALVQAINFPCPLAFSLVASM